MAVACSAQLHSSLTSHFFDNKFIVIIFCLTLNDNNKIHANYSF